MLKLTEQMSPEEEFLRAEHISSQQMIPIQYQYQCLVCLQTAQEPVVSKCGHLFCWKCVYSQRQCHACDRVFEPLLKGEFVPIYTSHLEKEQKSALQNVPQKPKATRKQKIKNASTGFSNDIPYDVRLHDNVSQEILVAGNGYLPPIIVNAVESFNCCEGQQGNLEEEDTNVKGPFRKLQIILLSIVIVLILLS